MSYENLLTTARIRNPLAGIPHDTLMQNVSAFAQEKGLTEHTALLQKGALVAQDPANYEDISGEHALDATEVDALRNEVLHKWRQPMALYVCLRKTQIPRNLNTDSWERSQSLLALLVLPFRVGIRLVPTAPTCPSLQFLVSLVNQLAIPFSSVLSTLLHTLALPLSDAGYLIP